MTGIRFVVGSPATVRSHVDEPVTNGLVEYVIGRFAFDDLSHAEAMRSLEPFAEHVVARPTAPSIAPSTAPEGR